MIRVFIVLLASISLSADEPSRTWTDTTGKYTRVGIFETITGKAAVIRQTVGAASLELPLDKLSMQDLVYLLSRPSVASGTLESLSTNYAMSSGGTPLEIDEAIVHTRGRLSTSIDAHTFRVKLPNRLVAVLMTPNEAETYEKRDRWSLVKIPNRLATGPKGVEFQVYMMANQVEEKDLLVLLASHRDILLPHLAASDPPPEEIQSPTTGSVRRQGKQSKRQVEQIEPSSIAEPNAPAGAHFLDAVHGRAKNLTPAQKAQQTSIRNQVDDLEGHKKKIERELKQLYETKPPKEKFSPADAAKSKKLKTKAQKLEQEIREHRVKYQLIGN